MEQVKLKSLLGLSNFTPQDKIAFSKTAFDVLIGLVVSSKLSASYPYYMYVPEYCCVNRDFCFCLVFPQLADYMQAYEKAMHIFPEYIGQTRVRRSETEVLCGIDKVLNICNELKVQHDLLSFFSNFQMRRSLQMRLQKYAEQTVSLQTVFDYCLYRYLISGYGKEEDFKKEFLNYLNNL